MDMGTEAKSLMKRRQKKSPASSLPKSGNSNRILASNLRLLQLCAQLTERFDAEQISYLLLKGAAFVDTLYQDISTRSMTDIDLLVPLSEQERVDKIVKEEGFSFISPPENRAGGWKHHYNWQYQSVDGALIEIHFALSPKGMFKVDYIGLFRRKKEYSTPSRTVTTLSPEDTLLSLAIHEAKHAYSVPAHSSEDIKRLLETWPPNWNAVIDRAASWGCKAALFITLSRAQRKGANVPNKALKELAPSRAKLTALRAIFGPEGQAQPRLPTLPTWFKLVAALSIADNNTQRRHFVSVYAKRRITDLAAMVRST